MSALSQPLGEATSSYCTGLCESCNTETWVRMYVLQDGNTAWVCDKCRKG